MAFEEHKADSAGLSHEKLKRTDSSIGRVIPVQWEVETVDDIQNLSPSQFHPEKKWMATHYKLERPDGSSEEVPSDKTLIKIKSQDGTVIEVPAFAAEHILSLHLKGSEAGSTMESNSLASSFKAVVEHLPREIPFDGGKAAFEIDLEQTTGSEGVTTQKEMLEKGIATDEDIAVLASIKENVFKLNLSGSDDEKKAFIDQFNGGVSGNVKVGIRGGAITPFFTTERQPTTKMFLVVGKEQDADGSEHNRVWTMAPGRFMEQLPTDGRFTGRFGSVGVPEGTTVSDLWKKAEGGEKLTPQETALVDAQRRAQECWWEGGFIDAPKK